jgi:hypothetical protein
MRFLTGRKNYLFSREAWKSDGIVVRTLASASPSSSPSVSACLNESTINLTEDKNRRNRRRENIASQPESRQF